jgi:hypothetical protein
VQVIKSLDSLLKYSAFAGFERGTADSKGLFVNFGQGFGAISGNKVIYYHMKVYDNLLFKSTKDPEITCV